MQSNHVLEKVENKCFYTKCATLFAGCCTIDCEERPCVGAHLSFCVLKYFLLFFSLEHVLTVYFCFSFHIILPYSSVLKRDEFLIPVPSHIFLFNPDSECYNCFRSRPDPR